MSTAFSFAQSLAKPYESFRCNAFPKRHFLPETLVNALEELFSDTSHVNKRIVGKSFEGRPISLFSLGSGNTGVLLWSQMHGDESTATMAIADMLSFFIHHRETDEVRAMLSSLTIHFLPMLNPDGAVRIQRRTAQNIDMNRDAVALATPEACILKNLQHELKPAFGYNLHDQELSTVAQSKELTAIGLLAPAMNAEKSYNDVRTRARHLASFFGQVMDKFIPGKIARYDDTFEPRAFGDNVQRWGTSTILVESGHVVDDFEKQFVRKLNVIGILASLHAIATGEYASASADFYESLPFNGKKAYDVILRGATVKFENGQDMRCDLGISYQVDTHSEQPPKLVDIGDLSTYTAWMRDIDGKKIIVPASEAQLGRPFEWEKLMERTSR